jgi:hypothetical protein
VELVHLLDQAEAAARRAGSTAEQLEDVLGSVCAQVDAARPPDSLPAEPLLRPVLLELLFRLFGQVPLPEDNARHRGPS